MAKTIVKSAKAAARGGRDVTMTAAQRAALRRDDTETRRSWLWPGVFLVTTSIAVLAGYQAHRLSQLEAQAEAAAIEALPGVAQAPVTDKMPVSAQDYDNTAEKTEGPAKPTTVSVRSEPAEIGCASHLEGRLGLIQREAADMMLSWSANRDRITRLVQQALNCPDAGIDIVGSLDLVGRDLSDLLVSWDKDRAQLTLTAIANGAALSPILQGQEISFVLLRDSSVPAVD